MRNVLLLKIFIPIFIFINLNILKAQNLQYIHHRSLDKKTLSAPDSLGVRKPLKPQDKNAQIHLPYPVIFIHGLNSNSSTWNNFTNYIDTTYNLTFGGRMDFCLNHDNDNSLANLSFTPSSASDIAFFTGVNDLSVADYYYINFDVGLTGSVFPPSYSNDYVLSNQSAIYKQGLVVKYAIEYVLQKTGREKVILHTHSMGGLAARHYIQHPELWQDSTQADGHKVAKLITTGTPHGGSNASGGWLSGIFTDLDESSEAVRDLRRTYFYSGDSGVYLHGGYENASTMDDQLIGSFYNYDVNCNGTENEYVSGLNDYPLPLNLDFTCIIGDCSGCFYSGGDGVVSSYDADLAHFYNIPHLKHFYYYASSSTEIHTQLPDLIDKNMMGLDEPDLYPLAYKVFPDTVYYGFITNQDDTAGLTDVDIFKFTLTGNSQNVEVKAFNINVHNLGVSIYDANYSLISPTVYSNGIDSVINQAVLPAGDYYLVISDTVTGNDHLQSYKFIINSNIITNTISNNENEKITIYPNPSTEKINIILPNNTTSFNLINPLGEIIYTRNTLSSKTNHYIIDVSNLSSGVYIIVVHGNNKILRKKIIVN